MNVSTMYEELVKEFDEKKKTDRQTELKEMKIASYLQARFLTIESLGLPRSNPLPFSYLFP